jgi:hypothetical protein
MAGLSRRAEQQSKMRPCFLVGVAGLGGGMVRSFGEDRNFWEDEVFLLDP